MGLYPTVFDAKNLGGVADSSQTQQILRGDDLWQKMKTMRLVLRHVLRVAEGMTSKSDWKVHAMPL